MKELTIKLDKIKEENERTTIILADDHPLLLQALKDVLDKQPDFEVVAEAHDGEEAIRCVEEFLPDVVIMDISMPNMNGIEATRRIKSEFPQTAVLVLTVHNDNEHILNILEAGAGGYLTKSVYGNEITNAIRSLVSGEMVLSPSVSKKILKYASQHCRKPQTSSGIDNLTSRELEILILAANGISNKDIAARLGLSLRTIKGHLEGIFLKLSVSSRTEAVIVALKKGILSLNDLD